MSGSGGVQEVRINVGCAFELRVGDRFGGLVVVEVGESSLRLEYIEDPFGAVWSHSCACVGSGDPFGDRG